MIYKSARSIPVKAKASHQKYKSRRSNAKHKNRTRTSCVAVSYVSRKEHKRKKRKKQKMEGHSKAQPNIHQSSNRLQSCQTPFSAPKCWRRTMLGITQNNRKKKIIKNRGLSTDAAGAHGCKVDKSRSHTHTHPPKVSSFLSTRSCKVEGYSFLLSASFSFPLFKTHALVAGPTLGPRLAQALHSVQESATTCTQLRLIIPAIIG